VHPTSHASYGEQRPYIMAYKVLSPGPVVRGPEIVEGIDNDPFFDALPFDETESRQNDGGKSSTFFPNTCNDTGTQ